jgi:hypothetical protein
MRRAFLAVALLIAWPALAQAPAAPPTDLELEQQRSAMLAAQLQYFVSYIRRIEAQNQQSQIEAKELAAWWASYVAGLAAK